MGGVRIFEGPIAHPTDDKVEIHSTGAPVKDEYVVKIERRKLHGRYDDIRKSFTTNVQAPTDDKVQMLSSGAPTVEHQVTHYEGHHATREPARTFPPEPVTPSNPEPTLTVELKPETEPTPTAPAQALDAEWTEPVAAKKSWFGKKKEVKPEPKKTGKK